MTPLGREPAGTCALRAHFLRILGISSGLCPSPAEASSEILETADVAHVEPAELFDVGPHLLDLAGFGLARHSCSILWITTPMRPNGLIESMGQLGDREHTFVGTAFGTVGTGLQNMPVSRQGLAGTDAGTAWDSWPRLWGQMGVWNTPICPRPGSEPLRAPVDNYAHDPARSLRRRSFNAAATTSLRPAVTPASSNIRRTLSRPASSGTPSRFISRISSWVPDGKA